MNISKKISRVKIGKKKVVIVFDDNINLEITPNVYTEFNLFAGKSLSKKEIDEIKKRNDIDKYYSYAIKLCSERAYTKKKIKDKLIKKGANETQIDDVIDLLIKYQLIDDSLVIKDFLEYADYKHFGFNRIKEELFNKGISSYQIDKLVYDEKRENKHAKELIKPFEKKYAKYNYAQLKKHCYDALIRQGFNYEVANNALEYLSPIDEKHEKEILKEDYQKAKKKFQNKVEKYELDSKITEYLLQKGYRYADIQKIKEKQ